MADSVLIDTSIWIDFFRNQNLPTSQQLIKLLDKNTAFLTGIVLTELFRGVKTDLELKRLENLLQPVPLVSPNEETWHQAGIMAYQISRKGFTIFTIDAIIATIAIQHKMSLYSTDKHFLQIAAYSNLELYR